MKQGLYRHGDLCLKPIDKLPKGLKKESTKVLLAGNTGNNHSFDNGSFYPKAEGEFVRGYFVAKNTTLSHVDHGEGDKGTSLKAKISDGVYEVRGQVEKTHEGMKQVID